MSRRSHGPPRVWPAVFIAQCAAAIVLLLLLVLGHALGVAPSNIPGNAVFGPWPLADLGSAIVAAAWGVVVAVTIASLLRPMLSDQPQVPSLATLAFVVAVGGYVPFALSGGFIGGDAQSSATFGAIVLTSVLVRLTVDRVTPGRPRLTLRARLLLRVAVPLLALAVVVAWAAFHPIQVDDLYITDADGSSTTSPPDAHRRLRPGAAQRVDVAVSTAAAVRMLDVELVTPSSLELLRTTPSDLSQALPRDVGSDGWINARARVTFRTCTGHPVSISAVRVRYVRLGRPIQQTLPLPTTLTLRCERGAR